MDFINNGKLRQKAVQWGQWIFLRKKEYPVIDKLVMAYIAIMLLFQIFFQISPMVTFLATTPLYSMQTYLGLLGGGLIILDLFTTKRFWQGKFSVLLYAILLLAALASVRMISYGIKENLFKLCWAGIQFVLIYSCAYRLERNQLRKYIKVLFYVLLVIWLVACVISLCQYVNQIGYMYVVNPLAKDSSATRQGFYDNRLFGIFYTLNHAAYISLFFFLLGVIHTICEKRLWTRGCLILANFVLLCHIILSNSRSAMLSLFACLAVLFWCVIHNRAKASGIVKVLISAVTALALVAVCFAGYQGLKYSLAKVPAWKATQSQKTQIENDVAATEAASAATATNKVVPEKTTAIQNAKPQAEEGALKRKGLEEDVSNGRLSIWADYVSLYKEIGPVGLSPGNYMPHIMENYPELYIVDYIKNHYPDKYASGIIYHVHSGYMMVYVSAGILGLLCLAAFMLLCLIRTLHTLLKNQRVSWLFIGSLLLVIAGAISAALDEALFFQNMPHTTMFWLALGVLLKETLALKKNA